MRKKNYPICLRIYNMLSNTAKKPKYTLRIFPESKIIFEINILFKKTF